MQKNFGWIEEIEDNSVDKIVFNISIKNVNKFLDKFISENNNIEEDTLKSIEETKETIHILIDEINNLIKKCEVFVQNMDFKMLYDEKRGLFSIGYDIENQSLSNSYYDLLASEARQASFVAIAKGEVETTHWFKLGRAMAAIGMNKGLVSWTGTMFEYLMPLLIMKPYPNTLLDETYKSIVAGQKRYGRIKNGSLGYFRVSI